MGRLFMGGSMNGTLPVPKGSPVDELIFTLKNIIRELVRNDGLYGGAPCWSTYEEMLFREVMNGN